MAPPADRRAGNRGSGHADTISLTVRVRWANRNVMKPGSCAIFVIGDGGCGAGFGLAGVAAGI